MQVTDDVEPDRVVDRSGGASPDRAPHPAVDVVRGARRGVPRHRMGPPLGRRRRLHLPARRAAGPRRERPGVQRGRTGRGVHRTALGRDLVGRRSPRPAAPRVDRGAARTRVRRGRDRVRDRRRPPAVGTQADTALFVPLGALVFVAVLPGVGVRDERTGDRPFLRVARRLPVDPRRLGARPTGPSPCPPLSSSVSVGSYDPSSHCSARPSSSSSSCSNGRRAAASSARVAAVAMVALPSRTRSSAWATTAIWSRTRPSRKRAAARTSIAAGSTSRTSSTRTGCGSRRWPCSPVGTCPSERCSPARDVAARCGLRSPSASARSCTSAT